MMFRNLYGIKRAAAITLVTVNLTGCGFHLVGTGPLPQAMEKTFIRADDHNTAFFRNLRDTLRRRGVQIVSDPGEAGVTLSILEDGTGQRVVSVTARNVPREYEIFYKVKFALTRNGHTVIEPKDLAASRVYAWNETKVLGKAREAQGLRQALAQDITRRVLRRIEAKADKIQSVSNAPGKGSSATGPAASTGSH